MTMVEAVVICISNTSTNKSTAKGRVQKPPARKLSVEGGGVPPFSVNFFPLGFREPTVRGGGGVPPLSVKKKSIKNWPKNGVFGVPWRWYVYQRGSPQSVSDKLTYWAVCGQLKKTKTFVLAEGDCSLSYLGRNMMTMWYTEADKSSCVDTGYISYANRVKSYFFMSWWYVMKDDVNVVGHVVMWTLTISRSQCSICWLMTFYWWLQSWATC